MKKKFAENNIVKSEPKEDSVDSNPKDDHPRVKSEDGLHKIHKLPKSGQRPTREGRLIVRNLPYKISLDKLKEHFSKYGELTDATILKKPDGKLVGCGFVQYSSKDIAAKAVAELNGKPLLGRPVIVDWAVPKNQYLQIMEKTNNIKTEDEETADVKVKQEDDSISLNDEMDEENSMHGMDDGSDEDEKDHISEEDEEEEDDDQGSSDDDDSDMEETEKKNKKELLLKSDVSEGCTVFIKNIPFNVGNDELREAMKQFGKLQYALICVDPLTEHSRGTGFVKFKSKASAEACLTAGSEKKLSLEGRVLEVHRALSKEDANKPRKKDKEQKDNRNLYLAKEGLILPDSPAATGVSKSDMDRRLGLEEKKRRLLRNLHHFISPTRLTIYNLPANFDDCQLRSLFLKHGGPKSVITEARIMRNLRDVDANGKGRSKGFGFITFTSHDNALQALRNINNNPSIFSPAKRPIVMFSIENRSKLNIKKKRLERSRKKLNKDAKEVVSQKTWEKSRRLSITQDHGREKFLPPKGELQKTLPGESASINPLPESNGQISRKERRRIRKLKVKAEMREKKAKRMELKSASAETVKSENLFQGVQGKPGQTSAMSRKKLEEQVQVYQKRLKEDKKLNRQKKLLTAERIKQPKQKMRKSEELNKDDKFSKIVSQYKEQLSSTVKEHKKWYDG